MIVQTMSRFRWRQYWIAALLISIAQPRAAEAGPSGDFHAGARAGSSVFSRSGPDSPRPWWANSRARTDSSERSIWRRSIARPAVSAGLPVATDSASRLVADPDLWGANGNVLDMEVSGNTLYLAGAFRSLGENTGGFVPTSKQSGEPRRPFPKVAGSVYAVVPDGSGGWFIGGEFSAVAGKPRACLAQIRADGSLSDWNPSVTGSPGYIDPPTVSAIAILGDRIFVGGGFEEIGGQPRTNLGCVDARTGSVLDWNPGVSADGWVMALAAEDSSVFVGGYFFEVGGQSRWCLAAVDAFTGEAMPWQGEAEGRVWSLLAHQGTLYVGGEFGRIAGVGRWMLAALDAHTGRLLPFNAAVTGIYIPDPGLKPFASALALAGDTLFVGGNFSTVGGRPRPSVAALDATTGAAFAWDPPTFGPVYEGYPPQACFALAVDGSTVYVGGSFIGVGDSIRPFAAAFSRDGAVLREWNPKANSTVRALQARPGEVLVGGEFISLGDWWHRAGLAAIDLSSGRVKPWNPNPDGSVCTAVAVKGDRVFVSGSFTTIGGDPQPRRELAALDTLNGEVVEWDPGANSVVNAFLIEGDTLYAVGEFTEVGGQPRRYAAALNTMTGEVLPWDPNANSGINAIGRSGQALYLGGIFQMMGGEWRRGLAAVDASSGALLRWNPDIVSGVVEALLVVGNTVYVGGGFQEVGGQPRSSLAALDAVSGEVTSWDAAPVKWGLVTPRIRALALLDSSLIVGGNFSNVGGQPRICLAAVDTMTGLSTAWDPMADGLVWSLTTDGSTLFAGGGFERAGGIPATGLVAFRPPSLPPLPEPVSRLAIESIFPNPLIRDAIVRFAMPEAGPVRLEAFDIGGRRMATLLREQRLPAGRHQVALRTSSWPLGVYYCRLEYGGRTNSRRFVVVR